MEPVYYWKYTLRARKRLNAVSSRREFEGALLRIGTGFGCLHPWPELGDPCLEDILSELRSEAVVSDLAEGALRMVRVDGAARGKGKSLLDSVMEHVPKSHATAPEYNLKILEEAVSRGYRVVKIKGDKKLENRLNDLEAFATHWPHLLWRIDFNEVLTCRETINLCEEFPKTFRERIDFLEDPCPWSREEWELIQERSGLKLARDRGSHSLEGDEDILVIKPARTNLSIDALDGRKVVVTSNMDHPLGQCFAAYQAGTMAMEGATILTSGLQTHDLFELDAFTERLGPAGPEFGSPGGMGLGFDDLLENLPWKRLV